MHGYCPCRALIVSTLVKKLLKKWRNNLSLHAIAIDFPRAGAGEKGDARCRRSQRKVHREAIASNQTLVILHIGQMLEKRRALRQHIDDQPLSFERLL